MNTTKLLFISLVFVIMTIIKPMDQPQPLAPSPQIETPNLDTMPQNIIEEISNHLTHFIDMARLKMVCRYLNKIALNHHRVLLFTPFDLDNLLPHNERTPWNHPKPGTGLTIPREKIVAGLEKLNSIMAATHYTIPIKLYLHDSEHEPARRIIRNLQPLGQLVRNLTLITFSEMPKEELQELCRWTPQLTVLHLNVDTELPDELETLKELKKLAVVTRNNNLGNAHIFTKLPKLQQLSLSFGTEQLLPQSLTLLEHIRKLKLSLEPLSQFSIGTIICKIKMLEELVLISCKITELPQSLGELKNLKKLYVSFNKLTLPSVKLICTSSLPLVDLDLSYNNLKEIPEEIGLLSTTLKKLNIEGNHLNPATKARIKQLLPNAEIIF